MKRIIKRKNKIKKQSYEGSVLNSRYIVEKNIADGGLCHVAKAKDIYSQYFGDTQKIVVKYPLKKFLEKKDISAFLYAEYKFLRSLNHKNIIKVFDYGIDVDTNLPYIILEHCSGQLLCDISLFEISPKQITKMFKEACSVLKYIHEQEIIHCDISPQNIILLDNNEIKFFDFGISQYNNSNKNLSLSYENNKAFNQRYASASVMGGGKHSCKSDFFSLACVFYEMFTFELPYKESPEELKKNPINYFNISKKVPFSLRYDFIRMFKEK